MLNIKKQYHNLILFILTELIEEFQSRVLTKIYKTN